MGISDTVHFRESSGQCPPVLKKKEGNIRLERKACSMLADSKIQVNPENGKSPIEQLAEATSVDLAKKLVRHYPGVELRPPLKIEHSSHHLVRNLGRQDAELLCQYAGADTILVPRKLPHSLRFDHRLGRDEFIRRMVADGLSRREMALQLGLSQRYVRRLVSKLGLSGEMGCRRHQNKPNSLSRVSNAPLTGHEAENPLHPTRNTQSRSAARSGGNVSRYGFANIQTKESA